MLGTCHLCHHVTSLKAVRRWRGARGIEAAPSMFLLPMLLAAVVIARSAQRILKVLKFETPKYTGKTYMLISQHQDCLLIREHQPRKPHPDGVGIATTIPRKGLGTWEEDVRGGWCAVVASLQ